MKTASLSYRLLCTAAAIAGSLSLSNSQAQNLTAGDRYLVDLAVAGMPINLSNEQQVAAQAQLPSFEDFTPPGQIYLNILAHSGWLPAGGESVAPTVVDAFTTPGAGYLSGLSTAGWNPPGAGFAINLKTPGERYLDMLAEAGWQPQVWPGLTELATVVAR